MNILIFSAIVDDEQPAQTRVLLRVRLQSRSSVTVVGLAVPATALTASGGVKKKWRRARQHFSTRSARRLFYYHLHAGCIYDLCASMMRPSTETPLLHAAGAPSGVVNSGLQFWSLSLGLVLCAVTELGLQNFLLTYLFNYRWFFTLVVQALSFVALGVLYYVHRADVTPEMLRVSKVRFGLMALLDCAHSIILAMGVGVLPGPLAILLPQVRARVGCAV